MSVEPRWVWKKKVLLLCLQLSKLPKTELISLSSDFDLTCIGLKDELVYNIQRHIQSNLCSPRLNKKAVNKMMNMTIKVSPQSVINQIAEMQRDTGLIPNNDEHIPLNIPSNKPKPKFISKNSMAPLITTGLLSDAIRKKHNDKNPHDGMSNNATTTNKKSSNSTVDSNTSRPFVKSRKNINPDEINTNPRHNNVSYSFPELPFYPRVKLLDDIYISPITNKKIKKRFYFDLNKNQYKGLQNNEYKIFFFCGSVPISIDIDDSDDEEIEDQTKKHEIIPLSFPQAYQFINMRTGTSLERYRGSSKKNQRIKPIDVTDLLSDAQRRGDSPLQFSFHFVPAMEYYMSIYLVDVIKTEDIVTKICERTKILRNATLYYLKKLQDPENGLLATSITMSLECPISGSIMKTPVKSTKCLHLECFDAYWYLESQRQLENNRCPICSKSIKSEDLAISEFIEDILTKCPPHCHKVQLTNDGHWDPIIDSDDEDSDMDSDDDEGYGYPPPKKQKPSPQKDKITLSASTESSTDISDFNPISSENITEISNQNSNESSVEISNIDTSNENNTNNYNTPIAPNTSSFPSLDPGLINVVTPTNNKTRNNLTFNSESDSTADSPFSSQMVPNILGSTPLNRNNYKGLPTTKTFHNLAAIRAHLEDANSMVEASSLVSVNNHPIVSHTEPQVNTNITATYESQGDIMQIDHDLSLISTPTSEGTVLHGNLEKNQSILNQNPANISSCWPTIPKLPNLPTLPFKFIHEKPQHYKDIPPRSIKKPVVVPFNAKLNAANGNILPQKRQLSNTPVIIKQPLNNNFPQQKDRL